MADLSKDDVASILSGELQIDELAASDDASDSVLIASIELAVDTRTCPRDGRPLDDRDNPRNPGLNRELFCSCGFAVTT